MKLSVKRLFLYTFFIAGFFQLLLVSCAREAMPLGGPKDTIPPQVIKSYPQPFQTHFKDKKIVIKFNEYFDLKNLNKEFFVSPPFGRRPVFAIRGKRLIVHLRDSLRDSVTYTFEFGNAIVDYTEGNPLENFKLVFSTYDQIDTLRVSGKVVDAATGEPVEGVYVMLYKKNMPDSVVYQQPPQYVTVTDKKGGFQIIGVKKDCYKIVAINDLNHDFIYDGIENQIGFLDTLICVDVRVDTQRVELTGGTVLKDSATGQIIDTLSQDSVIIQKVVKYLPDNIFLRLFTEHTRPQQIVVLRRPYPVLCIVRFSYPLHKNFYRIRPMQGSDSDYVYFYDSQADSLDIWVKREGLAQRDTLGFVVNYLSPVLQGEIMRQDTIIFERPKKKEYRLELTTISDEIAPFDSLLVRANVYVCEFNTDSMQLIRVIDTALTDPKNVNIRILRVEPGLVQIYFSRPLLTRYKVWVNHELLPQKAISYNRAGGRMDVHLPVYDRSLDTVDLKISYWLRRFYNYDEYHEKTQKIVLTRQKLLHTRRIKWDSLVLTFIKPLRELSITGDDLTWKQVNPFTVGVKLTRPQDTVEFKVRTLDFAHLGDQPIYYEQDVQSIYKWVPNKIKTVARVNRQRVVMIFDRRPAGVFLITALDPKLNGKKNTYQLKGDTLVVDFQSKEFKRMKVNKIIVGHYDLNRINRVELYDTVDAEIDKNPLLKSTKLYQPQKFEFNRVSGNPMEFKLTADLLTDSKYRFLGMPGSFRDVLSHVNDSVYIIDFKTTDVEEYGSLEITFTGDSLYFTKSQLIAEFLDKDGNIMYRFFVDKPQLEVDRIKPGDYTLRFIFDRNKNGRWDTGNYLRHEQPEKVVLLPKKISAKANWQIEETINIKTLEKK